MFDDDIFDMSLMFFENIRNNNVTISNYNIKPKIFKEDEGEYVNFEEIL